MKKLLVKLSILPVLALAVSLSTPSNSAAQTEIAPEGGGCPSGTFKCTCNGIESCQSSIADCWNSC
jgi:hypothetical protein